MNILQPGPGVGGHCIAVDPWFIINSAPDEAKLIHAARKVNNNKPDFIYKNIKEKASRIDNPVIACLGLSFKANVSDLRESPALDIVCRLAEEEIGYLLIVEPYVNKLPECLLGRPWLELVDLNYALTEADIVVLLVNHNLFYSVNKKRLKQKIVIDTRGIWW